MPLLTWLEMFGGLEAHSKGKRAACLPDMGPALPDSELVWGWKRALGNLALK
jgi:hypothetical protein